MKKYTKVEKEQNFVPLGSDYSVLFGAVAIIAVEPDTKVWIGGAYTDGAFAPPPQPEPLPEIVEGESEVLPEPEATEPPDDSIPG